MKRRRRKCEFSKVILGAVMIVYFTTTIFSYFVTADNPEQLGELLTFVGAPTAVAIGFYAWKAKAENIIKISSPKQIKEKFIETECDDIVTGTDNTDDSGCTDINSNDDIPCYQSEEENNRVVKVRRIGSRKGNGKRDRTA